MRITRFVLVAAVSTLALAAPVQAQDTPRAVPVPLEVKVVVAKYQGDKRISSLPYMLAVNAAPPGQGERTQLTIGSDVAVPTTTFTPAGDGKPTAAPLVSYSYRNVGTVISAGAVIVAGPDERFDLDISIDETSVGTNTASSPAGALNQMPVFKSFKTRNKLVLRNGQTREFVAATDRVSGETVKIEVTLTVLK